MSPHGQTRGRSARPQGRVTRTLLTVSLVNGAVGAPLVGALREQVQETFGLSFWSVGAGVAALGAAAGVAGLILTSRLARVGRLQFIRLGLVLALAGFVSYCFLPAGAWQSVLVLAVGWFVLTLGRGLTAVSNAVFADLWRHSPHTGVILLHATNSIGKVLAPVLALLLTAAVTPNAIVYSAILAVLTLDALCWPRRIVTELTAGEQTQRAARQGPAPLRRPLFWLICAEFMVIAGSEAGVASSLPSFIERHRPALAGLSARGWSEVVLAVMTLGIVAGRFGGVAASRRVGERPIIVLCLACTAAVVPAVASSSPWVYLPCFFVLGVAFSSTWPANFALAARAFPGDETVLSMGAALGTLVGVNGFVLLGSLIGNAPERLGLAVLVCAASMGLFAVAFAIRPARAQKRLHRPGQDGEVARKEARD